MQLGGRGDRDRERAECPPLALEQRDTREQEHQHEEIVPAFDDEREELRVQRDQGHEREPVVHAARQERHDRERREVGRQVQVALVPEEADLVEEPHERGGDQEQEWEVREVIERGAVHHRPVVERGVEIVGDVGVLPEEQLARGPLDHQRTVVDVRVRLPGLAQHDRRERWHDDEGRDDRRDVHGSLPRRERAARHVIAHRVRDRQHAAGDEEYRVRAEREQLPERHVARRGDGRVVPE